MFFTLTALCFLKDMILFLFFYWTLVKLWFLIFKIKRAAVSLSLIQELQTIVHENSQNSTKWDSRHERWGSGWAKTERKVPAFSFFGGVVLSFRGGVVPYAGRERAPEPGTRRRCSPVAGTGWRDEPPGSGSQQGWAQTQSFTVKRWASAPDVTLVTALQKSSECRKWTRAGTCRPKLLLPPMSHSLNPAVISLKCSYWRKVFKLLLTAFRSWY